MAHYKAPFLHMLPDKFTIKPLYKDSHKSLPNWKEIEWSQIDIVKLDNKRIWINLTISHGRKMAHYKALFLHMFEDEIIEPSDKALFLHIL